MQDNEGDLDCVRCANPQHEKLMDELHVEHAYSGNCTAEDES